MAEEPQKVGDGSEKPKRFSKKLIGIIVGVAVFQGAAFFTVFKLAGSTPEPAHGEESHVVETRPDVGVAEVSLVKGLKVPNDKSGRMWIYDIDISVVIGADQRARMEKIAEERKGEIGDRIARVVRAATDQMLREDDLQILRGQLQSVLSEISQDPELIQRVLIPRFVPIPS